MRIHLTSLDDPLHCLKHIWPTFPLSTTVPSSPCQQCWLFDHTKSLWIQLRFNIYNIWFYIHQESWLFPCSSSQPVGGGGCVCFIISYRVRPKYYSEDPLLLMESKACGSAVLGLWVRALRCRALGCVNGSQCKVFVTIESRCVCVCVCCRLQQLDRHCQSSAQQVCELLAKQSQLMQERNALSEEMQNLRIEVHTRTHTHDELITN